MPNTADIYKLNLENKVLPMNTNEPVSLKTVSYMMVGGAAVAVAFVAVTLVVLGIFVY